jgi:hypothetical protein
MSDKAKVIAELAAMRSRGELSVQEFEGATRLVLSSGDFDGYTPQGVDPNIDAQVYPDEWPERAQPRFKILTIFNFFCLCFLALTVMTGIKATEEWRMTPVQIAQKRAAEQQQERERVAAEKRRRTQNLEAEALAKEQKARAAAIEKTQQEAREAEDKRTGRNCYYIGGSSPWFEKAVKGALNDPNSFEHVETRVGTEDERGMHTIVMTFRARNGFGGMLTKQAIGSFRSVDCQIIEWNFL